MSTVGTGIPGAANQTGPGAVAGSVELPPFGHAIRRLWMLEDETLFLNHGSYGATPRVVLAAQDRWRERMERQPLRFFGTELPAALRAAAAELGDFLRARGEDLVFVDNATTGANIVLQGLPWKPGDELLLTTHGYGAVRKAAVHLVRRTGLRLIEARVPFPLRDEAEVISAVTEALSERTRLVVLDHVTSPTALILPVGELSAVCHRRRVPVLIDGAHGPGMLDMNIPAIGADYYIGNCHKWLCAPKGSAFLWVCPERHDQLHPLVISHGLDQGFHGEFDWTGTRDPSPCLAVPDAVAFHERLGPARVRAYMADLAAQAAALLAQALGTDLPAPRRFNAAMATIPLPGSWSGTDAEAAEWHDRLLARHAIEVPFIPFYGHLWVRICAQVYNEIADYARLAEALHTELGR